MEFILETIIYIIIALIIGSFIFKIIKHGGFKAAMFDAKIKRTVGEVSGTGSKLVKITLKVHELEGNSPEKAVGLELFAKTVGSFQMMPITLSNSTAKELAILLNSISNDR